MQSRTDPATSDTGRRGWRRAGRRVLSFSLLWLVLSGGEAGSWLVGAPMVATATWLSLRLWSAGPAISLWGLARFCPWFARQSIAGAVDVALRALRPSMPLYPGLVSQRLRLPEGAPRVALANVISMLPGTLSADLEDDEVTVHALDARQDLRAMILDLEPRIAAVFGVDLDVATERQAAT